MRLFGILLIVVILLAGGGYVYLGVQDYKGRQQINAAGLRHLLVLQGLPLEGEDFAAEDETPFRIEMAGGESTKTVSKKLLENYFKENAAPPRPRPRRRPASIRSRRRGSRSPRPNRSRTKSRKRSACSPC